MSIFCDLLVGDSRMEPVDSWDWPQVVYGKCEVCGEETQDNRMMLNDRLLCDKCAEMEGVEDEDDAASA